LNIAILHSLLFYVYRLGKTIQVIAFLSGLFDADLCHAILIVLPVAVIINWEKEFAKWLAEVYCYNSLSFC